MTQQELRRSAVVGCIVAACATFLGAHFNTLEWYALSVLGGLICLMSAIRHGSDD